MEADAQAGGRLAPTTTHPSPLSEYSLCCQILEVGAVCGNSACTDLSAGRPAIGVLTANITHLGSPRTVCTKTVRPKEQQHLLDFHRHRLRPEVAARAGCMFDPVSDIFDQLVNSCLMVACGFQ